MGIRVTTDLVMDVMRAAQPQKVADASRRLAGSSATTTTIAKTAPPSETDQPQQAARAKAHQEFEAAMLRTFTEQMMPKDASSLYGDGTAGNIWRSLQVDLMSQQIAKSGGIGIAKMLDESAGKPLHTAQSLGLNEMLGGARQTQLLSSAAQWPYFATVANGES